MITSNVLYYSIEKLKYFKLFSLLQIFQQNLRSQAFKPHNQIIQSLTFSTFRLL